MTGGDGGQEPERVLHVGKQAHVRVRERGPRPGLETVMGGGQVRPADDVEPLLDIILVLEPGVGPRASRLEERVEVELLELARVGDGHQLLGHLVCQQAHLGQGGIRVRHQRRTPPELLFRPLLVRVRPVEDLFLDELTGRHGSERGPGKVQVCLRGDRQDVGLLGGEFAKVGIDAVEVGAILVGSSPPCHRGFLPLEELLGRIPPCPEVVLVEHHEVPLDDVQPLVLGLDVPDGVTAKEILEGTEVDQGLVR